MKCYVVYSTFYLPYGVERVNDCVFLSKKEAELYIEKQMELKSEDGWYYEELMIKK